MPPPTEMWGVGLSGVAVDQAAIKVSSELSQMGIQEVKSVLGTPHGGFRSRDGVGVALT